MKQKTPLRINLRQNQNTTSRTYGMWYPEADRTGTLTTRALCAHIAAHGRIWTRDIVEGVLSQLSQCIPELVSQGFGVKLNGIGIFMPTINSAGKDTPSIIENGYNPDNAVKGVRINFLPDRTKLDDLSRHAFKEYCVLEAGYATKVIPVVESGKVVDRKHVYLPLAEWSKGATFPGEGNGNSGGGEVVEP